MSHASHLACRVDSACVSPPHACRVDRLNARDEANLAAALLQRASTCNLAEFYGVRLASHTASCGLPQSLRDADNAAILAYVRLNGPGGGGAGGGDGGDGGGGGGDAATGEDTYRVHFNMRPRHGVDEPPYAVSTREPCAALALTTRALLASRVHTPLCPPHMHMHMS